MISKNKSIFIQLILLQMYCASRLKTNNRDQEEFEDITGVIRIRISKRNRQHNGQKKKYKRKNNDLQSIKIKIE
jgi:hypothetical protein